MKNNFLYASLIFLFFCCSHSATENNQQYSLKHDQSSYIQSKEIDSSAFVLPAILPNISTDTSFDLKFKNYLYKTIIKVPDSSRDYKGVILALHGWNLPHTDWCDKTELCKKATEQGYIIILPEMGKSTYSNYYYPETRKDWIKYPTRKWFQDSLITYLQNEFGLLIAGQPNYILGLSTGGKGAALIALDNPDIFKAAAVLSADFDHTFFPKSGYYIGFYGQYEKFKERWIQEDNLMYSIKQYAVPTYLGHGLKDNVSPANQTVMFYDSLRRYQPDLSCTLHIDSLAKHDYPYWNSEVDPMLRFFGKFKKQP